MFRRTKLTPLQLRKQVLLLESHLNRQTLQNQVAKLRGDTAWVAVLFRREEPGSFWARVIPSVVVVALRLAAKSSFRWAGGISRAFAAIDPFVTAWNGWRRQNKEETGNSGGGNSSIHQQNSRAL